MGARGLDSEKELEFYMRTATSLDTDTQSNLAAIAILDNAYGDGSVMGQLRQSGNQALLARVNELEAQGKQLGQTEKTIIRFDAQGNRIQ